MVWFDRDARSRSLSLRFAVGISKTKSGNRWLLDFFFSSVQDLIEASVGLKTRYVSEEPAKLSLAYRLVSFMDCESGYSKVAWASRESRPWIHE